MMIFDLNRFIDAQSNTFSVAFGELQNGRKVSHWMWYVFPQLKGLGKSEMSEYYGIAGIAEARAYMEDPVLGFRLIECSQAVLSHSEKSAKEIFGDIDSKKLRSCMTLFREATPEIQVFDDVLETFFNGKPDYRTLRLLGK